MKIVPCVHDYSFPLANNTHNFEKQEQKKDFRSHGETLIKCLLYTFSSSSLSFYLETINFQ